MRFASLILSLILISNTFPSYDSLTQDEKEIVQKAFMQSSFYKALYEGTDDIEIIEIHKIKEERVNDNIRVYYQVKVDIIINQERFRRTMTFYTEYETLAIESNRWQNYSLVFLSGIILGYLISLIN